MSLPALSLKELFHPVPLSYVVYDQGDTIKLDLAQASKADPTLKKDLVLDMYVNLMGHIYVTCCRIEEGTYGKSVIDIFCANLARDIDLHLEQNGLRAEELKKFRAW